MDAKEVTKSVLDYFQNIKQVKFSFEVKKVEKITGTFDGETWIVTCDILNLFDDTPKTFEIGVNDATGDFTYIKEIE
jgi:hypothetical protein